MTWLCRILGHQPQTITYAPLDEWGYADVVPAVRRHTQGRAVTWRLTALLGKHRKATMTTTQPETAAATVTAPKGVDYSTGKPKISALVPAGIKFVIRYTSPGSNPKNLTKPELTALLTAGLEVGLVFESTGGRMLSGHGAGAFDATVADQEAKALGLTGIPLYFACDFDATPGDQTQINAYLDGVADSIGRARTGIYGGFWPVHRALDAAKATWAWQTYAWSLAISPLPPHAEKVRLADGRDFMFDTRAQLRQVRNGVPMGGGMVDLDEAHAADSGLWPRPKPPAGPVRHVVPAGNTQTWHQLAASRGTTDHDLADVTRANLDALHLATFDAFMVLNGALRAQGSPLAAMPEGLVWWSLKP